MTTNDSGKLNMGGVDAIKSITLISPSERTARQSNYLDACLTALAHQPAQWYGYQDWGKGGPVAFLAKRGIRVHPHTRPHPCAAVLVRWLPLQGTALAGVGPKARLRVISIQYSFHRACFNIPCWITSRGLVFSS